MKLILTKPVIPLVISQYFGEMKLDYTQFGLKGHNGWDIPCPLGTKILATHDGKVIRTEIDSKGGIGIDVRTKDKYEFEGQEIYFKTRYWHNQKNLKTAGEWVKRGEVIALADNTGFSTGSHLHWGLKPCDSFGDPLFRNNGYFGAIDIKPFFEDISAKDYNKLLKRKELLTKLVELYKQLVALWGKVVFNR